MAAMTMAAAMAVPAMADEESVTIGISQFAEHGSLDNCREGFLEGLKEAGYEEGKNLTIELSERSGRHRNMQQPSLTAS